MQSTRLLELSEDLSRSSNCDEFWDRIMQELQRYGVTSVFYGAASSRKEMLEQGYHSTLFMRSNHPEGYFEALGSVEFLDNDLSVEHVVHNSFPIFWHEEPDFSQFTAQQKDDWFISNDFGMEVGVTVATASFSARNLGGFGLCMAGLGANEFQRLWRSEEANIQQILGMLDVGMRQQHLSSIIGLAPREIEVLKWLANGLRPHEIADRLNIGYRTVDKYIAGFKRKLDARTRDHAVAKALLLGIVQV